MTLALAAPTFPPLLRGETSPAGQDPLVKAVAAASLGTAAGLVVYAERGDRMAAALVLAPEEPLETALTVCFAVALGLGDALGALAPPEVAVHFDWPGGVRVNGAPCGTMRVATDVTKATALPGWLVIALDIPLTDPGAPEPGLAARTCLAEEGCAEITAPALIESWSRHTLHWIHRRESDGVAPLHDAWRARAWGLGEPLADGSGNFMGLDEHGGRLVKTNAGTRLDPLTLILEAP